MKENPKSIESSSEYKKVVQEIKELNWENLNPQELQQLMTLSYASAVEFAEALRIALTLYPDSADLKKMAAGELDTDNLSFDDYNQSGDHAEFLKHFINKYNLDEAGETVEQSAASYHEACVALDDKTRAMSIFSREQELSGIFERILEARDWDAPGLAAFRYYLSTHIGLDSSEGGHAELTDEFKINDKILAFYQARLEMYRAIPKLFVNQER